MKKHIDVADAIIAAVNTALDLAVSRGARIHPSEVAAVLHGLAAHIPRSRPRSGAAVHLLVVCGGNHGKAVKYLESAFAAQVGCEAVEAAEAQRVGAVLLKGRGRLQRKPITSSR